MLSGVYDYDAENIPDEGDTGQTVMAQVIHFGLITVPSYLNAPRATQPLVEVWSALYRVFPFLSPGFDLTDINDPGNGLTLTMDMRDAFHSLAFALEPTSVDGDFQVLIFNPKAIPRKFCRRYPTGSIITLPAFYKMSALGFVPATRKDLLLVHATLAKVLHSSGAADAIEQALDENTWQSLTELAPDGSTHIAEVLTAKLIAACS